MEDLTNPLLEDGGIVYSVTTKVEHSIAEEWLNWLMNEHIHDLIATGCFHAVILQLMEVRDDEGPNLCRSIPCKQ